MNPESWTKNFRGFIMPQKRNKHTCEDRLKYMKEGLQCQLHQRALWHRRQVAAVPMEKVPDGRANGRVEEELQLYS